MNAERSYLITWASKSFRGLIIDRLEVTDFGDALRFFNEKLNDPDVIDMVLADPNGEIILDFVLDRNADRNAPSKGDR